MEGKITQNRWTELARKLNLRDNLYRIGFYLLLIAVWQILAMRISIPLLLPTPKSTLMAFINSLFDSKIMTNVGITFSRVIKGWLIALVVGIPLGLAMGLSKTFNFVFGGLIHSLRQVPMMAWVPLTIIWLGIGEGPTLFMIALNGLFQIILNTTSGVSGISRDYFNAARSMGASRWSVFKNVVIPGAMPDMLVGARLAVGSGWMSVI